MKIRPWIVASALVWTLAGAVALAAYSGHPALKPTVSAPSNPDLKSIVWESSFEDAMKRARAEGKPIMIDFYAPWCGPCKMMDAQTYPDAAVIGQSGNWVSVKIDGEKRPDVMQTYGVTGYPTILWVQSNGQPLESTTGFVAAPEFAGMMQNAWGKWKNAKT